MNHADLCVSVTFYKINLICFTCKKVKTNISKAFLNE